MRKFKVWNCLGKCWIEDGIDDFVEFNWVLPGYKHAGESCVETRNCIDIEIVWQNNDGNFIPSE